MPSTSTRALKTTRHLFCVSGESLVISMTSINLITFFLLSITSPQSKAWVSILDSRAAYASISIAAYVVMRAVRHSVLHDILLYIVCLGYIMIRIVLHRYVANEPTSLSFFSIIIPFLLSGFSLKIAAATLLVALFSVLMAITFLVENKFFYSDVPVFICYSIVGFVYWYAQCFLALEINLYRQKPALSLAQLPVDFFNESELRAFFSLSPALLTKVLSVSEHLYILLRVTQMSGFRETVLNLINEEQQAEQQLGDREKLERAFLRSALLNLQCGIFPSSRQNRIRTQSSNVNAFSTSITQTATHPSSPLHSSAIAPPVASHSSKKLVDKRTSTAAATAPSSSVDPYQELGVYSRFQRKLEGCSRLKRPHLSSSRGGTTRQRPQGVGQRSETQGMTSVAEDEPPLAGADLDPAASDSNEEEELNLTLTRRTGASSREDTTAKEADGNRRIRFGHPVTYRSSLSRRSYTKQLKEKSHPSILRRTLSSQGTSIPMSLPLLQSRPSLIARHACEGYSMIESPVKPTAALEVECGPLAGDVVLAHTSRLGWINHPLVELLFPCMPYLACLINDLQSNQFDAVWQRYPAVPRRNLLGEFTDAKIERWFLAWVSSIEARGLIFLSFATEICLIAIILVSLVLQASVYINTSEKKVSKSVYFSLVSVKTVFQLIVTIYLLLFQRQKYYRGCRNSHRFKRRGLYLTIFTFVCALFDTYMAGCANVDMRGVLEFSFLSISAFPLMVFVGPKLYLLIFVSFFALAQPALLIHRPPGKFSMVLGGIIETFLVQYLFFVRSYSENLRLIFSKYIFPYLLYIDCLLPSGADDFLEDEVDEENSDVTDSSLSRGESSLDPEEASFVCSSSQGSRQASRHRRFDADAPSKVICPKVGTAGMSRSFEIHSKVCTYQKTTSSSSV